MPPVPFKVPAWADPNNASVLDSPLQKAARTLGGMFGAADPQAQVMSLATPIEVPVGWKGVIPDTVSDIAKYQGSHTPPMKGSGAPLHDLTGGGTIYPDDVYGAMGSRYYGTGARDDATLFARFRALRNKPDEMVTIYRAVPKEAPVGPIRHGDWVTIDRRYAMEHGESALKGHYRIQEGKVPAKTLFTNGDSPYEFGIDLSVLPEKKP
jgi:hypothetical protein